MRSMIRPVVGAAFGAVAGLGGAPLTAGVVKIGILKIGILKIGILAAHRVVSAIAVRVAAVVLGVVPVL